MFFLWRTFTNQLWIIEIMHSFIKPSSETLYVMSPSSKCAKPSSKIGRNVTLDCICVWNVGETKSQTKENLWIAAKMWLKNSMDVQLDMIGSGFGLNKTLKNLEIWRRLWIGKISRENFSLCKLRIIDLILYFLISFSM